MYYHSAEVDEDLHCSYCKEKFTDVIKLVPSCGESICGECYDEIQGDLDSAREFTCRACKSTHLMPIDGLTDNRGLCRLIKKRKIEKPISDQARRLREVLASLNDNLTALNSFDPREYIHLHCDNLEVRVTEAFESAITRLHKLQQELLEQVQDYRNECLKPWTTRGNRGINSAKKNDLFEPVQKKLQDLNKSVAGLTTKWNRYFTDPATSATDDDVQQALNETDRFDKTLESLRSSINSRIFGGQLMTFRPVTSFFEDDNHLKEAFNFKLELESTKVLRLQTPPSRSLAGHTGTVYQVIPISGGRLASCSKDKAVKVWNPHDGGSELFELKGHATWVTCLVALPNGWLASGSCDRTIKLWNLNERKEVRTLKGHTGNICSLVAFKNGNLASFSIDDTIRIWNPHAPANNLLMKMSGHGNRSLNLPLVHLSNEHLVTCSNDPERHTDCVMRVWNPNNGQLVKAIPAGNAQVLTLFALSNDQVALGFRNGTIKLIDWTYDAKSRTKERAHNSSVSAFAQLSNVLLLSTGYDGSSNGYSIKMWNLGDFSLLQVAAKSHSDRIRSLSLSPDKTHLASAGRDLAIKLWSVVLTDS